VTKPRHSETIRGMDSLSADHMIVIDMDGNLLEGQHRPATERFIHTQIYRARPDVLGIVHTHQTPATVFGVVGRPILPILHVESPLVAHGIPIYPSPELIETPALGDAVAQTLADYQVCHLQGHGIVTVAERSRRRPCTPSIWSASLTPTIWHRSSAHRA
jgi:ribulose-5-phosphate 4-epimerase/fuculose-1-phosphate aldolase